MINLKKTTMRFYLSLLFAALAACQSPGDKTAGGNAAYAHATGNLTDTSRLTTIEWKEQTLDFGKIEEGEKLDIEYHFTNTGEYPLVIDRVEPSCGCTMAEVPKEPVQPGKEGIIKASFNSSGRAHANHKTLLVYANAKSTQPAELSFDVDVQPKK